MSRTAPSSRLAAAVLAALTLAGAALAADAMKIVGAGSTFVAPFLEKMAAEYQKKHATVLVDYQAIGSGGGIKAILDKTVAFAASDAPLSKKELEQAGASMVQIPVVAGGVVPVFNVPGVTSLNLTGEVLADIFLGTIAKWNDPRIAQLNADAKLPDLAITPAWRTDGSGTTFVFTNWLALKSAAFKQNVGMGKQVRFPVGQGGKGNPGVAAIVQQTPGALGYVEESYATANKIAFAAVKNKAGKFVKASTASISKAAENAAAAMTAPTLTADIWEQPGDEAYPIASFTYAIVYADMRNLKSADEARALGELLWWLTHDAQAQAAALGYAPLPAAVQAKVGDALGTLTYGGKPMGLVLKGAK